MRFQQFYEARKLVGNVKPPKDFSNSIKSWVKTNINTTKPVLATDIEIALSDYENYIGRTSLEQLMSIKPVSIILYNYDKKPIQFPFMKGKEGEYRSKLNRLILNTSGLNGLDKNSKEYKLALDNILTAVDHELMHWVQYKVLGSHLSKDIERSRTIQQKLADLNAKKASASPKDKKKISRLIGHYYSINPIELGPIAKSAALDIIALVKAGEDTKEHLTKVFTGQVEDNKYKTSIYPQFFKALKTHSAKSWKNAIKIFNKELDNEN